MFQIKNKQLNSKTKFELDAALFSLVLFIILAYTILYACINERVGRGLHKFATEYTKKNTHNWKRFLKAP